MSSKVFFIPASQNDGQEVLALKSEKIFKKFGLTPKLDSHSFVALKIHFGEKGNTGYINPFWLKRIIKQIRNNTSRVFFTDTNTLYAGKRSNAVDHLRLAWGHGFRQSKLDVPIVIADGLVGRDSGEVKVGLSRIKSAKIASAFLNSDMLVCLSHFTGHILTGFGAAIKNIGMGCASRKGKLEQHSDVHPWVNPKECRECLHCLEFCPSGAMIQKDGSTFIVKDKCIGCGECLVVCPSGAVKMHWDEDCGRIQEKMAEYAYSVWKRFEGNICFLNYLLKITKDCDCMSKDGQIIAGDIGILGSPDPVALDQASVDLVNEKAGKDILRAFHDVDWSVQLRHGAEIGLGTTDYKLIELK